MTNISEEELREDVEARIERFRQEDSEEEWAKTPEEGIPTAHGFLARDARHIALASILLGSKEEARQWTIRAAEHRLRSGITGVEVASTTGDIKNAAWVLTEAMWDALLSGDADTIGEVSQAILDLDREHEYESRAGPVDTVSIDRDKYFWARGLAGLVTGDDDVTTDSLGELRSANENNEPRGIRRAHFESGERFLAGTLNGDENTVVAGIERMLARHEQELSGDPKTDEELLCLEATSMLILARRLSFGIDVESEYIPTDYVEWLESQSSS